MPRTKREQLAWDVSVDEPGRSDETRFPDLVAFASFGYPIQFVPGLGLPVNEVLPLTLVALALTRHPTSRQRVPTWFVTGLVLLLTALTFTSYLHGLVPARRLFHVTLYVALAVCLASGRIHLPSAARGLLIGLSSSIVLSIAGFGPNHYTGRLTGFLGDPNAGGYIVTVLGAVAVGLLRPSRYRLALMALIPVAVVLTYSRTTLLALTFAVVWVLVGRRANVAVGALIVAGMVYVVGHIPDQLRLFGPFSDRAGSDALRGRIIAREHLDIAVSPWIGSGAGTARVPIGDSQFFYHSSYLALQREGGLLCLALLIGVVAATFLSNARLARPMRNGWLEGGLICLLVCAVNLGEVLLELPAAVVVGAAMWHRLNAEPPPEAPPPPRRPRLRERLREQLNEAAVGP